MFSVDKLSRRLPSSLSIYKYAALVKIYDDSGDLTFSEIHGSGVQTVGPHWSSVPLARTPSTVFH